MALEVALATKPNYTILAEEVEANNVTLSGIVNEIADMVEERARRGKNYGRLVRHIVNLSREQLTNVYVLFAVLLFQRG